MALSPRVKAARIIAIVADVLQIALFPAFAGGWLSPLTDGLDVAVAITMIALVGWHFAFLPSFIAELLPGVDLIPTWTAAVWFATRGRGRTPEIPASVGPPPPQEPIP